MLVFLFFCFFVSFFFSFYSISADGYNEYKNFLFHSIFQKIKIVANKLVFSVMIELSECVKGEVCGSVVLIVLEGGFFSPKEIVVQWLTESFNM